MDEYISAWTKDMYAQTDRIKQLLDGITEKQLNLQPAPGKWSPGELVDHLIVSNELYFSAFDKIASTEHRNVKGLGYKIIPKFLGKMILRSITPETKTKYKTVSAFRPKYSAHSLQISTDFEQSQAGLITRVHAWGKVDLDNTFIPSPASRYVLYSLRDALTIILNHEKRHIGQIAQQLAKR